MLIEQIIEFELSGPGTFCRTRAPITGYFYDKTKIFQANFWVDYYLLLNYCRRQCTLLPSTRAKSQNLIPKCKILNAFWT